MAPGRPRKNPLVGSKTGVQAPQAPGSAAAGSAASSPPSRRALRAQRRHELREQSTAAPAPVKKPRRRQVNAAVAAAPEAQAAQPTSVVAAASSSSAAPANTTTKTTTNTPGARIGASSAPPSPPARAPTPALAPTPAPADDAAVVSRWDRSHIQWIVGPPASTLAAEVVPVETNLDRLPTAADVRKRKADDIPTRDTCARKRARVNPMVAATGASGVRRAKSAPAAASTAPDVAEPQMVTRRAARLAAATQS